MICIFYNTCQVPSGKIYRLLGRTIRINIRLHCGDIKNISIIRTTFDNCSHTILKFIFDFIIQTLIIVVTAKKFMNILLPRCPTLYLSLVFSKNFLPCRNLAPSQLVAHQIIFILI